MKYLAIPYTDPDPEVMQARFEMANLIAAELMKKGLLIYSPISHSHPIAQYGLPLDWKYWQYYDREIMKICDELIVIKADGWVESKGVREEIFMASMMNLMVSYLNPEDFVNA
jgi:hypothetical protein